MKQHERFQAALPDTMNNKKPVIRKAPGSGPDLLSRLIAEAFKATCEAEKIAAHGPRGKVYEHLLKAHSALLRAKNAR